MTCLRGLYAYILTRTLKYYASYYILYSGSCDITPYPGGRFDIVGYGWTVVPG